MSKYISQNGSNFSDYADLTTYNKSTMGIPVIGSNDPHNPMKYYQIVPVWNSPINYEKPYYDSLTHGGGCCNNYPGINQGYSIKDDCVKYVKRPCNLPKTQAKK